MHKFITLLPSLLTAWEYQGCFYTHQVLRKYILKITACYENESLSMVLSQLTFLIATSGCLKDGIRSISNIGSKMKSLLRLPFSP